MSSDITIVVHPAVKVILEGEGESWSAYVPSAMGCVATGHSRAEVEQLIREGLDIYFEEMHEIGVRGINEELAAEARRP